MKRLVLCATVTLAFAYSHASLGSQPETAVELGIRQAQKGDFATAVVTLDGVVQRLSGKPGQAKQLARAYLYLSVAYLGLEQTAKARTTFLEAMRTDPEMVVTANDFPPNIFGFLERVRQEAHTGEASSVQAVPEPTLDSSRSTRAAGPSKGSSRLPLILLGVGGAAGAGVAMAGGGGSPAEAVEQPTPGPVQATIRYLGATLPPDSTVSVEPLYATGQQAPQLQFRFGVTLDRDLDSVGGQAHVRTETMRCMGGATAGHSFRANEELVLRTGGMSNTGRVGPVCQLPYTTTLVELVVAAGSEDILVQQVPVTYHFVAAN